MAWSADRSMVETPGGADIKPRSQNISHGRVHIAVM